MARRKRPTQPPQPVEGSEESTNDAVLTDLVDCDTQLRRLLKAEQNQFTGVISRGDLHRTADAIRKELRGEAEVEEGQADD